MKKVIISLLLLFYMTGLFSQSCIVSIDSLKGLYTGNCKKGKAEGKGTAIGTDSYTGNFRNGYPDGQGKYVWRNGNWYEGSWKNGLFEGEGTLKKLTNTNHDSVSVLAGFWEKGKYLGKNEKPYQVNTLTNNISNTSVRKLNNAQSQVTITVKSVTGGASSISNPVLPKTRLINIESIEGRFEQEAADETSSPTSNKYILRGVTFPFYAILSFATTGSFLQTERLRLEIRQSGDWYVQVSIDN